MDNNEKRGLQEKRGGRLNIFMVHQLQMSTNKIQDEPNMLTFDVLCEVIIVRTQVQNARFQRILEKKDSTHFLGTLMIMIETFH